MIHIFIVNPFAGNGSFATSLREQIPTDVEFYVFTTTEPKGEIKLVRQIQRIFEGEALRFYCCGGSGTFRNVMNGVEDLSKVELAFIPYGLTNDFLKEFGDKQSLFSNISEMVHGDVINVDYIKTNHGVCLNSFSNGLDTSLVRAVERYRVMGTLAPGIPYAMAFFYSIFMSKSKDYEITIDDEEVITGRRSEVYIGNGGTIGGFIHMWTNCITDDGKGHYMIAPNLYGLKLVQMVKAVNTNELDKKFPDVKKGYGRKFLIRHSDGSAFEMNFDGELEGPYPEWEVEIVHKGLKFVVPKGVTANEK